MLLSQICKTDMNAMLAFCGGARSLEGGWQLYCRQKQINDQLVNAYYQRVVYLGEPDPRFLTVLYQGCELLTGLSRQELLDRNLLKAIAYNRIISASYLPLELRRTVIADASLNSVANLRPGKKEFRQMARTLPAASRRYIRTLPYEAAVMALVVYCALRFGNTVTAGANAINDSTAPVFCSQINEKWEPILADVPDLRTAVFQDPERSESESPLPVDLVAHTSDTIEAVYFEPLEPVLVQAGEVSVNRLETSQTDAMLEMETDDPDSNSVVAEPAVAACVGHEEQADSDQTNSMPAAPSPIVPNDASEYYYDIALSHELQDYTRQVCEEYGFPPEYAFAMMFKESSFRPEAVSSTNDYGIMQINKCNHAWLREMFGITDFLDAKQSIQCGVYMISQAYNKYGDIHKALMAYNMGDGGAAKCWKQGTYTSSYSRTIVGYAQTLVNTGRLP